MEDFPVISSILSPAGIAVFVRAQYALTTNTTCRILKTGINHTYCIEDNNEVFIFRVYSFNWRTCEEIQEELKFLELLKHNSIAVSYPVADCSGQFIQTILAPEGPRFAVMFTYAPGHKVHSYSKEIHFEIGKLMGKIHQLSKGIELKRITYTPDVLLNQSLENISKFLSGETDEMKFLMATRPLLERKISDAGVEHLRKGIVHLDIWFDNLNISDDNNITLFDFDFCGNGWLCLDIAYYIMQLHNIEKDVTVRAQKMNAFYDGYELIEKISEEEKALVSTLGVSLYYFYLGVQCSRFDNWSNMFINEVYLKRYISILIKGYYETTAQG